MNEIEGTLQKSCCKFAKPCPQTGKYEKFKYVFLVQTFQSRLNFTNAKLQPARLLKYVDDISEAQIIQIDSDVPGSP